MFRCVWYWLPYAALHWGIFFDLFSMVFISLRWKIVHNLSVIVISFQCNRSIWPIKLLFQDFWISLEESYSGLLNIGINIVVSQYIFLNKYFYKNQFYYTYFQQYFKYVYFMYMCINFMYILWLVFFDFAATDLISGNKRMVSCLQNANRKATKQFCIWRSCEGQSQLNLCRNDV